MMSTPVLRLLVLSLLTVGGESALRGGRADPNGLEQQERDLQTSQPTWYPVYTSSFSTGSCSNTSPIPSGLQSYTSQALCCAGAFGGQSSGVCLGRLPNPPTKSPNSGPTTSPTSSPTTVNTTVWYPDYNVVYNNGKCSNAAPLPNGRPTYPNVCACCSFAYAGQSSNACAIAGNCVAAASSTVNSTFVWYPKFATSFDAGTCVNSPAAPAWRNTRGESIFEDQRSCCEKIFKSQNSNTCIVGAPTTSPTPAVAGAAVTPHFYPVWNAADHNLGFCDNNVDNQPSNYQVGSTLFTTQAECCAAWFQWQPRGGVCVRRTPSVGTLAPTATPKVYWYPKWGAALTDGRCLNDGGQGNWMAAPDYLFTDPTACCNTHFPMTDSVVPAPFGISPCLLGAGLTNTPTKSPTRKPTGSPTKKPTNSPTKKPTV